jgi:hypothetical protein
MPIRRFYNQKIATLSFGCLCSECIDTVDVSRIERCKFGSIQSELGGTKHMTRIENLDFSVIEPHFLTDPYGLIVLDSTF